MKVLRIIGMLTVCVLLTSCGQKYPEAYGVYIKCGATWVPIKSSGEAIDISSTPEFLVVDSRLTHLSDKPDTEISLSPVKWVRWNMKALISMRGGEPSAYAKTKANCFVQTEQSRQLVYSPVNKRQEILIVSATMPISSGCYWLSIFGEKILCKFNMPKSFDKFDEQNVLDRWGTVFDESAGFSWDAYLVATGVSQQDEKYFAPQKVEALVQKLQQEIDVFANAGNIVSLIALCNKVRHLDDDLYNSAKSRSIAVIEKASSEASSRSDYPAAIGMCALATNSGIISANILFTLNNCSDKLLVLEKESIERCISLKADEAGVGQTINEFSNVFPGNGMFRGNPFKVTVTKTHIEFGDHGENRIWFGYIDGLRPSDDEDIKDSNYNVYIEGDKGHAFYFEKIEDLYKFCSVISNACASWKTTKQNELTVKVKARQHYWSERVYCFGVPFDVSVVDASNPLVVSRMREQYGQYSPPSGYENVEVEGKESTDGKWFRFRSNNTNPVTVIVRLCPAVFAAEDAERKRLIEEAARNNIANIAMKLLVGKWRTGSSPSRVDHSRDIFTFSKDGTGVEANEDSRPRAIKWSLDKDDVVGRYNDNNETFRLRIEEINELKFEMRDGNSILYGLRFK